jgi:alpha-galactosidase
MTMKLKLIAAALACLVSAPISVSLAAEDKPQQNFSDRILTPPAPATPRINGPRIYGQRPGHPFLYNVPVTGDRPMSFSADGLPPGLKIDARTGRISGVVAKAGEFKVTLHAKNDKGDDTKPLKIVIGDEIALTPPMGWNSWNCWGSQVSQEKVLQSAKGFVDSGLVNHGWQYINIDDAWQGKRGGEFNAIQPNEKFPDMKALCDQIHDMGLKAGIYSTPWVTSYATHIGGSAENPEGTWEKPTIQKKGNVNKKVLPWAIGKYHFATNDARQWAAWGIDYLKYDWNPNELPETKEMYDALNAAGRDVIISLSNSTPFANISELSKYANCWRTSGDIRDNWDSMNKKGLGEDKWEPYCRPGHWNDPDMLVVGWVGWGKPHPTSLTPDEQYTHISLWCLLASPLLIGCDMTQMDDFTLSLLTNDEVLEVNQDPLGRQAARVAQNGPLEVWAKDMEDGSKAVGLFNRGYGGTSVTAHWSDLGLAGKQKVRDLWRQKDLGEFTDSFTVSVPRHGVVLVRIWPAK